MNLVFFGPPGVGKGTYADLVAKKYKIPKIATGDMLREEVSKKTEYGKTAKKFMDKGELVPDKIVIKIVRKRLEKPDCKKGFVLDGFPRNLEQAEALEKLAKINFVLNFTLPEKDIISRISGRLTCRNCRAIYHERDIKPKKPGVCDICGGELYKRSDQKPEVVENRLEVYKKETKPILDFYRKRNLVVDIKAKGMPEDVFKRIKKYLADPGFRELYV